MGSNDETFYKRAEDQKWREGVNERLVSLTAGEVVQNDRLDDADEELSAVREILEGKAGDKNDNGMKGDLHEISVGLNTLRAIMAPDSLGQGGVIARLKALERKAGLEEKAVEGRWKFYAVLVGGLLSLVGLFLTNLDGIEQSVKKLWSHTVGTTSLPSKKPMAKTSRTKRRRTAPPKAVPTEATDEPAPQDVSE